MAERSEDADLVERVALHLDDLEGARDVIKRLARLVDKTNKQLADSDANLPAVELSCSLDVLRFSLTRQEQHEPQNLLAMVHVERAAEYLILFDRIRIATQDRELITFTERNRLGRCRLLPIGLEIHEHPGVDGVIHETPRPDIVPVSAVTAWYYAILNELDALRFCYSNGEDVEWLKPPMYDQHHSWWMRLTGEAMREFEVAAMAVGDHVVHRPTFKSETTVERADPKTMPLEIRSDVAASTASNKYLASFVMDCTDLGLSGQHTVELINERIDAGETRLGEKLPSNMKAATDRLKSMRSRIRKSS